MVKHEIAPKPLIITDYRIIKTVGSGSTGKVKLAEHVLTKEQVAIKMIPRLRTTKNQKSKESIVSRERRILREAATLYLLEHPNIVGLKDMLITEDYFFLIFEYIKGEELLDHIVARKKLSEGKARNYFAQLLSAVAYCHANGVVHRDLKIENVLIVSKTLNKAHPTPMYQVGRFRIVKLLSSKGETDDVLWIIVFCCSRTVVR